MIVTLFTAGIEAGALVSLRVALLGTAVQGQNTTGMMLTKCRAIKLTDVTAFEGLHKAQCLS